MSGVWIQIIQFLLAFSILVALHEWGHFIFARIFKTKVEKFYLFFDFLFPFSNIMNFSLWKKKKGDTEYGIGWFPLGGYVKIAGMVDESKDTEQLEKPAEPWEFRAKKPWQRLLIMSGGIIVNVFLAIFIYAMILFTWGQERLAMSELKHGVHVVDSLAMDLGFQDGDKILRINGENVDYYNDLIPMMIHAKTVEIERDGEIKTLNFPINFVEQLIKKDNIQLFTLPLPAIVGEIAEGTPASESDLQAGDKILRVNGEEASFIMQMQRIIKANKGQNITIEIERDNSIKTIHSNVNDEGLIGIQFMSPDPNLLEEMGLYNFEVKKYGFFEAFPAGLKLSIDRISSYAAQFKLIFNPKTGAYKGVGGLVSIGKVFPDTWSWQAFWSITAFLSLILAFMNLLPIPGLDGGHIFFTLIEMIIGRPVNQKVLEVATSIGLILLLALMLYANGMDIFRLFKK